MDFRSSLREAFAITLFATVLGFLYTSLTGKGFFAPQAAMSEPVAGPEMIEVTEAMGLFESGSALFVDSRHEFDYRLGHIRGATNIPLKDLDDHRAFLAAIPKERTLVTYCDGAECNSSIELAARLAALGFSDVRIFFGGWREWEQGGFPTEGSRP